MEENNDLLIVYKKGSDISYVISKMLDGNGMKQRVVNREIIFDTIGSGEYNIICSDVTDIEKITTQLTKECLGTSINVR